MSEAAAVASARQDYYQRIGEHNLAPLWEVLHSIVRKEPKPDSVPAIWHYDEIRDDIMESGALITADEAERRVLAANAPDFATIALRPRFVWGPGDRTLVPEVKKMVERGAFVWLDGGRARTSTTHIANLVRGAVLALEKGRGGEIYFVTDGEVTDFKSFLTRLLAAEGVELPERSLPAWLVRPAAAAIEGLWRTLRLRSQPPLLRHAVDLLCCDCVLDDRKARSELGYEPVLSVEQGLAELVGS